MVLIRSRERSTKENADRDETKFEDSRELTSPFISQQRISRQGCCRNRKATTVKQERTLRAEDETRKKKLWEHDGPKKTPVSLRQEEEQTLTLRYSPRSREET